MAARLMVGVLGATLMFAQVSTAQEVDDATRSSARQLGYSGVEAYEAQDYAVASDKLERAYRVLQVPTLGLWSARALVKLGKLVEAQERYLKVGRLPISGGDADVQRKAQADAVREAAALEPRIAYLQLELSGSKPSEVTLSIDGANVAADLVGEPRPVNPGTHAVVLTRGDETRKLSVTVADGEKQRVSVSFSGAPVAPVSSKVTAPPASSSSSDAKPAGSTQRTLGWVAVAAGGAGLVLGGVTGGLALGKKSDFGSNAHCNDSACGPSQQSKVDSYNSLRTISTVGFVAGGVLAAAGVVLVLSAPSSSSPQTALWLGPSGASLRRSF